MSSDTRVRARITSATGRSCPVALMRSERRDQAHHHPCNLWHGLLGKNIAHEQRHEGPGQDHVRHGPKLPGSLDALRAEGPGASPPVQPVAWLARKEYSP